MSSAACKRIISRDMKEIHKMKLNTQGIFIHFDEENIRKAKAVIIGPKESLYENGALFFTIEFPSNYPYSPPKLGYISTSKIRIHPNLYTGSQSNQYTGKVCLSILNTWSGPKWKPIMHIGSVLLTIQSLLDNMPIYHEPGYELEDKNSIRNKSYNEIVRYNTYKTLIYENLFLENLYLEIFKEDIQKHIQDNIQDILHK